MTYATFATWDRDSDRRPSSTVTGDCDGPCACEERVTWPRQDEEDGA